MRYRQLGKTGLMVSETGLGGEWLEQQNASDVKKVVDKCKEYGINILDCWMSEPNVRTNIGAAIAGQRKEWIIQGHIGSTWQNGQYVRTREMDKVKEAFEDLLSRMQTDYIDLGMIHFVDQESEFNQIMNGEFIEYVRELKQKGIIRHIGLSTHNPHVGKLAALSGEIEVILFSLNPAFDMLPGSEDINDLFKDHYNDELRGIAPERNELYMICERENVAITVMKGYAGGRLFNADHSPFGVALTPVQCLHYALTRPAVASVMVGCRTPQEVDAAAAYEDATDEQKDYATVLANAPYHSYYGKCTYCGHCAPCPSYIDIAAVMKLYDLAMLQETIPATIKAHYSSLPANASDCIGCAACEERCPFGVSIADQMQIIAKAFE